MIETLGKIVTILAVTGVILNNRKMKGCFCLWIFSNSLCAYIHWGAGLNSLFVRDIIFLCLAVEGWYKWSR